MLRLNYFKPLKSFVIVLLCFIFLVVFMSSNVFAPIVPIHGPDLVISRIALERQAVLSQGAYGKIYVLFVIVKNNGNVISPHYTTLRINAPSFGLVNKDFVISYRLKPGDSRGIMIADIGPLNDGEIHEVSATADVKSEVRETNESNNSLVKHFLIALQYGGVESAIPLD